MKKWLTAVSMAAAGLCTSATALAQTEVPFYFPIAVGGPITKIIDQYASDFNKDNPSYKVALPLAPWHTIKNWSGVKVPTMIIACESDIIAPVSSHAKRFYDELPSTTPKGFLEISRANHFCVNSSTSAANKAINGKIAVSMLKVYMDNDSRYLPFLKETKPATNLSRYLTSGI